MRGSGRATLPGSYNAVVNLMDFLDRMTPELSLEQFVEQFPHAVLVEIELPPGAPGIGQDSVTHRLGSELIRRQAQAARRAQVYPLVASAGAPSVLVGRGGQCQVVVDHPSVSKEHARFTLKGQTLTVEDLASTNGTLVNDRKLDANAPAPIRPDDGIRFGRATGFHLMDPPGFYHYLCLLRKFGLY